MNKAVKEKLERLYDELHNYMNILIESRTTPEVVPEVARVLMDLATLQSKM